MIPSNTTENTTVQFQIPSKELVKVLWKRWLLRIRMLEIYLLLVCLGIVGYIYDPKSNLSFVMFIAIFLLSLPLIGYRLLTTVVNKNNQLTDLKTVEFSESRLVVIGPNWRNELPWTTFRGFSEDKTYFYLHLASKIIASVLPKSAFTTDQQEKFREYAKQLNISPKRQ